MNLFFYLQTFILNYSFIVILSDNIFLLCFIKTRPFVKRKPVKTRKKIPERSRSVLGRFYCISLTKGTVLFVVNSNQPVRLDSECNGTSVLTPRVCEGVVKLCQTSAPPQKRI